MFTKPPSSAPIGCAAINAVCAAPKAATIAAGAAPAGQPHCAKVLVTDKAVLMMDCTRLSAFVLFACLISISSRFASSSASISSTLALYCSCDTNPASYLDFRSFFFFSLFFLYSLNALFSLALVSSIALLASWKPS